MIDIRWSPRDIPLAIEGLIANGPVAERLARRLIDETDLCCKRSAQRPQAAKSTGRIGELPRFQTNSDEDGARVRKNASNDRARRSCPCCCKQSAQRPQAAKSTGRIGIRGNSAIDGARAWPNESARFWCPCCCFSGVADQQTIFLRGESDVLPWVDGVTYLGRVPEDDGLFLPTNVAPSVPIQLFARAVRRKAGKGLIAVSLEPTRLVGLTALRTVSRDRLVEWWVQ